MPAGFPSCHIGWSPAGCVPSDEKPTFPPENIDLSALQPILPSPPPPTITDMHRREEPSANWFDLCNDTGFVRESS